MGTHHGERIADGHGTFGRAVAWGLGIGAASGGAGASIIWPPVSTIVGAVIGLGVAVVPTLVAAALIAAAAGTGTPLTDFQQRVDRTCFALAGAIPVAGLASLPLADGNGNGYFIGVGVVGGIVAELLLWRARLSLRRPPPLLTDDQFSAATST